MGSTGGCQFYLNSEANCLYIKYLAGNNFPVSLHAKLSHDAQHTPARVNLVWVHARFVTDVPA
eukprot:2080285-Ditylum_brightwellii.AAC.1